MAEEWIVKVDTADLAATAGEINTRVSRLEELFNAMTETMNRTQSYWIGEAGDAHRSVFLEQQPKREEILKRLREEVRDLQEMAGVYEAAERENVQTAQSLLGDVIV